jgi:hypothetical protein
MEEGEKKVEEKEAKSEASLFHKTNLHNMRFHVLAQVSKKAVTFILCIMQSSDSTAKF